jgi:glycosyltransferase involved in cell wall biosynthesis
LKILLISSQDYIHHPVPSRHHYIFERLSQRHEIHVAHFHISNHAPRETNLIVEETTMYPFKNLLVHYTLNTPYQFYRFNNIIKENKIDVVVAAHVLAGTAAIYAAKYNKIPVLFDLKDWFPDSAAAYFENVNLQNIVHNVTLHITKYNLKNSTKVTTVSPNLVKKLQELGCNSQLITNGVDTSLFKPFVSPLREKLGFLQDDFIIGFAGSIERWYDLDTLLKIPQYFPDKNIKLLIVGGSLFTGYVLDLKNQVKQLNLENKVTFTGIIPYEQLPDYINCMDICTIPLTPTKWKNIALPNKFFEYSACGKSIITTNIPNIVDFNCPNVYVYENIDNLIEHIKTIMRERPMYNLDLDKRDWNYKATEMENLLKLMVG